MKLAPPLERRRLALGAKTLVVVLMGFLVLGFFRFQVVRSTTWVLKSDLNRLRSLPVPAPRGTIFDRYGSIVADNVPGYSVILFPARADSMWDAVERMADYLQLSEARLEELWGRIQANPRRPLTVKVNAEFSEVSALEERRSDFPGLYVEMRPRRRYLAGEASAHIVGYLGEISSRELEEVNSGELEELAGRAYEAGMIVGKEGVERYYETGLQGLRGNRVLEVDARGRIVGSFIGVPDDDNPAIPGQDLRLNIDLELQKWVHRIFPDSMRGAVVALNVEDGGVLALYSSPTFDPNSFVGGIGQAEWATLNQDPNLPLFNRAVQGLYPPGSTWKLATAAIALDLGLVTPEEVMPVPCAGGMQYGNRFFRCWRPEGHGAVNLLDGIRHSCDTYFYQLGLRIGLDRLLKEATRIGFNERCGIDLPAEAQGSFPDTVSFWQDRFGYRAGEGEVLNLAIGQGPNSQTPLKMAQFYLAIARDGTAPAPRLARAGMSDEGGWSLELSTEALETMREGLRRVVQPGGTAYLASLEHWDLMGKTGTVQNPPNPDHAWFAGIAGPKGGPPEVVVVVIVEFGVSGSGVAAPLVAKTADYYLRRKHGIPVDTIFQTLGEHYRAGVPAPWALGVPQVSQ